MKEQLKKPVFTISQTVILKFLKITFEILEKTQLPLTQSSITCSKLTIETQEQGPKYVQS